MDKQTKLLLGFGVAAVAAYFLFMKKNPAKSSSSTVKSTQVDDTATPVSNVSVSSSNGTNTGVVPVPNPPVSVFGASAAFAGDNFFNLHSGF